MSQVKHGKSSRSRKVLRRVGQRKGRGSNPDEIVFADRLVNDTGNSGGAGQVDRTLLSPRSLVEEQPKVFPDQKYVPAKPTWGQRMKKKFFGPRYDTSISQQGWGGFKKTYFVRRRDMKNGHVHITVVVSMLDNFNTGERSRAVLKPGARLTSQQIFSHADCSLVNLEGAHLDVFGMLNTRFDGANLRNAKIGTSAKCDLESVSFDGANLENAELRKIRFNDVSFRGANVTGMTLTLGQAVDQKGTIDFTDSNITGEQFDNFFVRTESGGKGEAEIVMGRYSIDEAAEILGEDPDRILTETWTGQIEFRDKETDCVSTEEHFDGSKHYIPQWAVQNYDRTS